jgi:hypothetical protein
MIYEQHGSVPVLVKDRISKYSNLPYLHDGPFLSGLRSGLQGFSLLAMLRWVGVGGGGLQGVFSSVECLIDACANNLAYVFFFG